MVKANKGSTRFDAKELEVIEVFTVLVLLCSDGFVIRLEPVFKCRFTRSMVVKGIWLKLH